MTSNNPGSDRDTPTTAGNRHGFRNGERVRDRRDGTRGRVRFLALTADELASGDVVDAEVQWDGMCHASELALVAPHLERDTPTTADNPVGDLPPARVGEVRVAFHATAYGLDGQPANGGQLYADRWQGQYGGVADLYVWAAKLMAGNDGARDGDEPVGSVTIGGRELEFRGDAWSPVRNPNPANITRVRLFRPAPVTEYRSERDRAASCYRTSVMDYPELVHERRIDGSCRCGLHRATYGATDAPKLTPHRCADSHGCEVCAKYGAHQDRWLQANGLPVSDRRW